MSDIQIERDFRVSPKRLFDAISRQSELLQWWGPEGSHVIEGALEFSAEGPWFAVLKAESGQMFKMSGHVTHVDAPNAIGLTWGWHDMDSDARGPESHVTFKVTPTETGARLRIRHVDLQDDDTAAKHNQGWTSSLNSLAHYLH